MRVKMLTNLITEGGDFLFGFVEKMAKIYEVPKDDWTYYTKKDYDKEGMEEELKNKLMEFRLKMKNVSESAENLMLTE